jgi:hypothetical protein
MDGDGEQLMESRVISVRHMDADEEGAVKALAGRAFSPLASISFSRSPDALIAKRGEELLGAVVLRTFRVPGNGRDEERRGGVMLWLMVEPGARRLGCLPRSRRLFPPPAPGSGSAWKRTSAQLPSNSRRTNSATSSDASNEKLRHLMEMYLMAEIGFEEEEIEKAVTGVR